MASDNLWREAARRVEGSPDLYPKYAQLEEALASATEFVEVGDPGAGARVLGDLATSHAAADGIDLSLTFSYWVRYLNLLDRREDAALVLRAAHATLAALDGRYSPDSIWFQRSLRSNLLGRKRWEEAATLQERIVLDTEGAYGEPATSQELRHLEQMSGWVPGLDAGIAAKRRELAVSVLRRALDAFLRAWPDRHPEVGRAHLKLGRALALANHTSEAVSELRLGLEICGTEPEDEVTEAVRVLNTIMHPENDPASA